MDVMGRVRLTDGTELKAVTGSTITHGVPDQILTDIHTESCRDRAVVVQVAAYCRLGSAPARCHYGPIEAIRLGTSCLLIVTAGGAHAAGGLAC